MKIGKTRFSLKIVNTEKIIQRERKLTIRFRHCRHRRRTSATTLFSLEFTFKPPRNRQAGNEITIRIKLGIFNKSGANFHSQFHMPYVYNIYTNKQSCQHTRNSNRFNPFGRAWTTADHSGDESFIKQLTTYCIRSSGYGGSYPDGRVCGGQVSEPRPRDQGTDVRRHASSARGTEGPGTQPPRLPSASGRRGWFIIPLMIA